MTLLGSLVLPREDVAAGVPTVGNGCGGCGGVCGDGEEGGMKIDGGDWGGSVGVNKGENVDFEYWGVESVSTTTTTSTASPCNN